MRNAHQERRQPDAASAQRTQRRSDAVVAQYVRELSGRHRRRGDEHGIKARAD